MDVKGKFLSLSAVKRLLPVRTGDLRILEQSIGLLRLSTFYRLQKKYLAKHSVETANALAVAVVTTMVLEPPGEEYFARFYDRNRSEISEEALNAYKHDGISGLSGCASYLYAAEILHCGMLHDSVAHVWDAGRLLQQHAAVLNILVPTQMEICGSNDTLECIQAIHSFARAFYYSNIWNGAPSLLEVTMQPVRFDLDFVNRTLVPVPAFSALPENAGDEANAAPLLRQPAQSEDEEDWRSLATEGALN